ncbi:MAG: Mrp/NBP35 family ATP-binding protein [Thaumarchaeota archaeon]|nr:MAG: Mrp/NBP35 family ATP-binding protein [Nitrososphaerota archaeon]
MVSVDQILQTLGTVIDPDLKKDIVSMGMIKDLEINGNALKFTLELTTPACPFNDQIEQDVRNAVSTIKEISKVDIKVTARVMEGRALSIDEMLPTVKNIIGIASGKGGVGKTTVAVNLALALSQTGAKVGVLDADIYGPSVPLMLGMGKSVMEVDNNKLQPAETHGLKVVSFGFFADQEHQAAIYRGPIISGILKQFIVDTNWTDLDYLIVDLPPGTGDIPLTLAQTIPITGIVVVTTPQEVASNVAVKAFGMFQKLNIPIMGVIENMSYFKCPNCDANHHIFGKGGAKKMSEKYNLPFLGEIPLNPGIMAGSDTGRPVLVTDPNSPHAQSFMTVAKNVAARCSVIAAQLNEEMKAEVATQK